MGRDSSVVERKKQMQRYFGLVRILLRPDHGSLDKKGTFITNCIT